MPPGSSLEHLRQRGRRLIGLLRAAWVEYERDHARYLAVAMVYYALVSLVPALCLLVAALGLLLRFSARAADMKVQVLQFVEGSIDRELGVIVNGLLEYLQQESIVAALVSLTGLVLTASILFHHLRLSFRAIWKYQPPFVSGSPLVVMRASAIEKIVALGMVGIAGAMLVVAFAVFGAVQWVTGLFGNTPLLRDATAWLVAVPGVLFVFTLTFALLFRFLPPVRLQWRHVWFPSLLCAVAWMAAAEVLALFSARFGSSGAYGVVGTLLAVMLWMNVMSQVLFYGAEVCKVSTR